MVTRFLLVALLAFVPMLRPDLPPVKYIPGQGCVVDVEWGSLTADDKAEVGRRLNICTMRHFPDSPVRW